MFVVLSCFSVLFLLTLHRPLYLGSVVVAVTTRCSVNFKRTSGSVEFAGWTSRIDPVQLKSPMHACALNWLKRRSGARSACKPPTDWR